MTQIREASVDDIPRLDVMRTSDQDAGPTDARMARYLIREHHPSFALEERVIFIAEGGDGPLGYIGGHRTTRHGCDGELQYLYVAPRHRGTEVARSLFRALAAWFEDLGIRRVCVDVVPENARARAFYAQWGAEPLDSHWMVWDDLPGTCREA